VTTLTEFLLARIAEDELVASKKVGTGFHHFVREPYPNKPGGRIGYWLEDWQSTAYIDITEHIARHDPARVLAECAAKRAIVEWHSDREDCCEERYGRLVLGTEPEVSVGTDSWGELTVRRSIGTTPYLGCITLMHLATAYSDHPDYDESWRP